MTDSSKWRVGSHYDIHIYNENGVPIATAMTPEAARQIVDEHNLQKDMMNNPEKYALPSFIEETPSVETKIRHNVFENKEE